MSVNKEKLEKKFAEEYQNLNEQQRLAVNTIEGPVMVIAGPGTGKTQIARVLANESGIAFMSASTADLKAGYIGQSGQKVKELFEKARTQSPCILFIDENVSL